MKTSWHDPELELLHQFNSIQCLAAAILPDSAPPELFNCYLRPKGYKTALPNPVLFGYAIFQYE